VSGAGDYENEMFRRCDLDDDTIDAIVSGRDPGRADVAMLVAFVEDARSLTRRAVPAPSAPLAAILADGLSTEKSGVPARAVSNVPGPANQVAGVPKWRKTRLAVAQLLSGLSVGAKAALGVGVAAAAVTGAGAAGALPGPAQHVVAAAVNRVTPFEFPDDADNADNANTHADNANTHADNADTQADFGQTVSSDATGTSDGQPGVDGLSIATTAAENGLSVARETPAGDHVPASVPPDAISSNGGTDQEPINTDESTEANSNSSNPPADPGSQSSNGIETASSTPAGDHVPTEVPPLPPQDRGSLRSAQVVPSASASLQLGEGVRS
jgi:hypothetical protein